MKLLITGAWHCTDEDILEIEQMGHQVFHQQWEQEPLCCPYEEVEGVVCSALFQHHPIDRFHNLRYIQLTSAGYDRIPMEYVEEHHIEIHNARGVYSIPMAEYAVAGVLQLYKQMQFFAEKQKDHIWKKHRGLLELYGRTVCIVGCGDVGRECAKRFRAFGCRVIGVNRTMREDLCYDRIVAILDFYTVLSEADIVVLCLPSVPDTYHFMNEIALQRLKSSAILVNIGRGSVLDTEALVRCLPQIGGAVLDVFEEEPLPENSPLWDMENVIITPHNSFVGDGNRERLKEIVLGKLREFGGTDLL